MIISEKDVELINKLRLDLYSKWKYLPSMLGMGKRGYKLTQGQKDKILRRWKKEREEAKKEMFNG